MAQASDIGANFSQYQGDVNLGGGSFGAAKLDTRPIEDLARYTFLYNKSLFDQRQKDADEKIAELAKLATIHVNDLRGKDRDEIISQLNNVITDAQDYARKIPKNPKEKIEQSLEWQKKTLDLYNNFNSGKARSVKYTAELDKIENDKTISEATKVEKRKELEQLFGGTKISEQFGGVPDYALSSISIPQPATLTANIIQESPNANLDEKLTIYNYKANGQKAFNILNGLDALYLDEKTPKGQTPQARQQRTIESEAKLWRDTADVMNSIIKGYQTVVDGKVVFDAARFEEENADNKRVMESYNALKNMDADARAKFSQAQQGRLSDRGFGFKLPPNFNADDFREGFVDFTKPIPADKIINAGMFGKFTGDVVEKAVTATDNDLDRQRIALGWANHNLDQDKFDELKKKSGSDFTKDIITADSVLSNMSNAIKSHKVVDVPDKSTKTGLKRYLEISDINLIEKYGKLGVNKDAQGHDGPQNDRLFLSQDENRFYLGHKDEDGKLVIGPQFSIEDWADNLTAGKMGASERGDVNTIISQVIRKYGNDALKLGYSYEGISPTIDESGGKTTTESTQTTKTPEGTMAEWLATPGWTKERVLEYKKKGLIKVK